MYSNHDEEKEFDEDHKPKETADETADETVRWNNLVVIVRSRTERGLEKEVSVQVSKKFLLNYPISSEKSTIRAG